MNMQLQVQAKATSTPMPSLTPAQSGLLQRKCACGGTPSVDVLRPLGQPLDSGTRFFRESRFGHSFNQVRVHADAPTGAQAKLTVNQPGDKYEQEADQLADAIVSAT